MSKVCDAYCSIFYPRRAESLRRRWENDETPGTSPLCSASLPILIGSSSFEISDCASQATMSGLAALNGDTSPQVQQGEMANTESSRALSRSEAQSNSAKDIIKRESSTRVQFGARNGHYRPASADKLDEHTVDGTSIRGYNNSSDMIDSLLMPDGVTIRKPPRIGISSGDPVAAHILKTKPVTLRPRLGQRSRVNLSLHRRAQQPFALVGISRARRPMSENPFCSTEGSSLPHITRFSPSLNSVLPRELRPIQESDGSIEEGSEHDDVVKLSQEADNALREVERAPHDADALYRLAVIKFRIGQINDARAMVEKFIQNHSNSVGFFSKGNCGSTSVDGNAGHSPGEGYCDSNMSGPKVEVDCCSEVTENCEADEACTDGAAGTSDVEKHHNTRVVSEDESCCPSKEIPCLNESKEALKPSSEGDANGSGTVPEFRVSTEKTKSLSRGSVCSLGALSGVVLGKHAHAQRRSLDLREGWPVPKFVNLEKLLGHLCFEEEDFETALRRYWRAIDLNQSDAQMFTSLGLAYYEIEDLDKAEAAFEHALKLDDRNTTALSVLAMLLMDKAAEREEEGYAAAGPQAQEEDRLSAVAVATSRCVELLERCLEIDETNILAKLHLAQVFFYREEWDRSENIFKALLAEMPNDTHLINNLGQVAFHRGDTMTAMQMHTKALEINPDDQMAHLYLCETLCARKDYKKALAHFVLCCEKGPDSVALHATCGLPLCGVGREREVISAYTKFIKQHPNSLAAKAFKSTLGSVEDGVGFFESVTIVLYIVLPILLVVLMVVAFLYYPIIDPSIEDSAGEDPRSLGNHFGEF